jgi:hypothetical protein
VPRPRVWLVVWQSISWAGVSPISAAGSGKGKRSRVAGQPRRARGRRQRIQADTGGGRSYAVRAGSVDLGRHAPERSHHRLKPVKGADPNFNGDGRSDILRPDSTENVAIWEMNGVSILNQATSPVAKCPLTGRSTTPSGRATSCGTTPGAMLQLGDERAVGADLSRDFAAVGDLRVLTPMQCGRGRQRSESKRP